MLNRRGFFCATVGLFAAVVTGGVVRDQRWYRCSWKVYPSRQTWVRSDSIYDPVTDCEVLDTTRLQVFDSAPFEWAQNTTGMRP